MYNSTNINEINPASLEKNVVLLDVRTIAEHEEGHLENSLHVDVMSAAFTAQVLDLDKTKDYLVYCRSGGRSATACMAMREMGFNGLTNLEGGMMSWQGNVATK